HIAIVDINEENGQKTLEELNSHADGMLFIEDISKRENIEKIVEKVVDKFGKLDILFNNEHAYRQAKIRETTMDKLDLLLNTGYQLAFNYMQFPYTELKKYKDIVINFASGAGKNDHPSHDSYDAVKKRIPRITRVAAHDWGVDCI